MGNKMNKSKFKFNTIIAENQFIDFSVNNESELKEFKKINHGKQVDVTIEIADTVQYYQHKYYRGYVLDAIAKAQGELDLDYLHEFVLKDQFLFFEVNDIKEIPKRHYKRCRITYREVIQPDGEIITKITGYVPSTSVLNFEEMLEYILKCEAIRDGLIDWNYNTRQDAEEYKRLRDIAIYGEEEHMKKLLREKQ